MASPSDDNVPESSEEEEVIDTGFDFLLFWDQYRQIILLVGGAVLLALVFFGIYEYNQSQRIAAAGAALAQAATEDDYRQVIAKYPGTVSAGDAALFLASQLRGEHKYDDALQVIQDFLDKYPNHPLVHAGDLSYAETLEAQGKIDEAVARYEEVSAKYPDSYSAPVAVIAEANILSSQGKPDQARRLYENFVAQFPESIFTQDAMAEMHLLHPAAGASAAPKTDAEGIPEFLRRPAGAPSAAPSAAAH